MGVSFEGRRMIGNSAMFCILFFVTERKRKRERDRRS